MNVRELLPHNASVLALITGCPLLFYTLACALMSHDPTPVERIWTDGTF